MADLASSRGRALQLAFEHLLGIADGFELPEFENPDAESLYLAREFGIKRYGDIGGAKEVPAAIYEPISLGEVGGVWVTRPGSDPDTRIVYLHGGGWRSGSSDDYRDIAATLAHLSGASVFLADYRLSPEHKFPAGLDDCVRAVEWVATHGPRARETSASHLGLVGDSAGGNLAAAACLRLIDANRRVPDRLALIAPTLDNVEVIRRVGIDDPICSPEVLATCTRMYLPAGHNAADPFVSPVFAGDDELRQFPRTLLQVSSIEALAWDSTRFASRLGMAQVRTILSLWPGLPHVWHRMLGHFPEARTALHEVADFLVSGANVSDTDRVDS